MIASRRDLNFFIITKRIDRFPVGLPEDWGDGYENVTICCTVENQERADYRLPIFMAAPIRHKNIICEPLLEPVDLYGYLSPALEGIIVGGESGEDARICRYDWVLSLREQCRQSGVAFHFKQTGAHFEKDGKVYHIARKLQHAQACKAGIDIL